MGQSSHDGNNLMGLKTGLICIGTGLDLTPETMAEGLFRRPVSVGGSHMADLSFQPGANRYCGRIADRLVLFDMVAAERTISGHDRAMDETLKSWSRATPVAAFTLHSVVNAYGFALYEAGGCSRRRIGSADAGIKRDEGQLTSSEAKTIERLVKSGFNKPALISAWSDASQTVSSPLDTFEHSALGEDFVVDMIDEQFGLEPGVKGVPKKPTGTVRELAFHKTGLFSCKSFDLIRRS